MLELSGSGGVRHLRCHALLARVEFTSLTNPTTVSTVYFQHDGHGNVALKSDSNGNAIRGYKYDAFGNILNPNASDTNPFRYCGEYYDIETGTYYLRARHYRSDLGRFTQEDTYRGDVKAPLSLNYYIYCYNDPVRYVDRSGNFPVETAADVVSLGWSAVEFISNPSLTTGAFLLWDVAATFMPYMPGAYSIKTLRLVGSTDKASDLARLFSKADSDAAQIFKENSASFIGSYTGVKNTVKALGITDMEVHHLIEKRFADTLGIGNKSSIISVALDKDTHQEITNAFRDEIGYLFDNVSVRTNNANANQIWEAIVYAYTTTANEQYIPLIKEYLLKNASNAKDITNWKGW